MDKQKSFLIIQTAFIGDVILATALVEKLHQFYPTASIDFLLRKGNETLLQNHPHLREVIIFDKKNKYRNLILLIKKIRTSRYDFVINVQRFATTGILAMLSKGKVRIGFDKNPLSIFNTKTVHHEVSTIHEVQRNQKLIEALTDSSPAKPRLFPSATAFDKIRKFQAGNYYCIAPTSVWFTKQWPAEKWIELIKSIETKVAQIYLLGAASDHTTCENILEETKVLKVINLAGQLSFLESAALMKGADMNFVNDSAPMHLASAMDAPVTAIYCSTVPSFGFGPLSDQSFIIETKEKLSCRPCGLHGFKTCPQQHFNCAKTISISQVQAIL